MPQVINTNIPSLTAQRNLNTSQGTLSTALSRLSSGLRVNSAKDDAAGIAIATRLEAQSRGMSVAIRNSNDALSFLQTAEGGVSKITESLNRMRELAVQSANGTYTSGDRTNLNAEFGQLSSEIARIASQTEFNGIAMFTSTLGQQTFQVGANTGQTIDVNISALTNASYTFAGSNISTAATATNMIAAIDSAMDSINTQRANLGGAQSRFQSVISQLQVARENQEGARSRIMDADFAEETARLTRAQILQQAGTAMLAQANSLPNNVLSLLR
ncbi:flagellin FliC [Dechloromonas sp. TW-R-39-2]|uniref:flagellin N-terminal helical domain-containing protein n=1 Tax=Dechloromonas sp. TW-R-39-2 TaxID=2654218 RepID=UPI00193CC465|nr:flagellin [Dechloromonas sp. TW-R-39-2]QRM20478.1 flagellin FliC [Dechloromonas sp. TW-R-39-2]